MKNVSLKFLIALLISVSLFAFACRSYEPQNSTRRSKVRTILNPTEKFGEPFGIAFFNDEIFISDGETGKIWRISNLKNFSVLTDKLDTPSAITFDKNGDLIVADSGTHTIKKVKIAGGEIETIAGVENQKGFADSEAKRALFNAPIGVAVFEDKIFVADTYNDRIRVIENNRVTTLAGSDRGFEDGAGNLAKFDTPCGLAIRQDGKILVADAGNKRLRLIAQNGDTQTLAGNGEARTVDGFLYEASFVEPTAVTIDDLDVIYVADGNSIRAVGRRLFPLVETISDTKRGFADGDLPDSKFNRPSGLATDKQGNLFVADAENQVLRVFTNSETGKEITAPEIEKLRFTPEEFRALSEPRWCYDPPENKREIAGTLGEIRGELKDETSTARFHNGLDVVGGYGETARFIRDEKVLQPLAVQNFDTLRELVRMPTLGYIHIRLGRDQNGNPFDDQRFEFDVDENEKTKDLRIPRGTKFFAGESIGTLNAMNHVHIIAGRSGAEMNALDALILPNISDTVAPTIQQVSLFDETWREIKTKSSNERIKLRGKIRVVARAFDQMSGNPDRRRLGVYRLGYRILQNEALIIDRTEMISFARFPNPDAVKFVYAIGSKSGATGETIFNYIVTNEVNGDTAREDFFNADSIENGDYVVRVIAADFFGNQTSKDIEITIEK